MILAWIDSYLYSRKQKIKLGENFSEAKNFDFSIAELTESLVSVQEWMNSVKLKLNPDKTDYIIIGDKNTRVTSTKFSCYIPSKLYNATHTAVLLAYCIIRHILQFFLLYGVGKGSVAKLHEVQSALCH